jgi:hypothetical protein
MQHPPVSFPDEQPGLSTGTLVHSREVMGLQGFRFRRIAPGSDTPCARRVSRHPFSHEAIGDSAGAIARQRGARGPLKQTVSAR